MSLTTDENTIKRYAKRIVPLQDQIKAIQEDIKELLAEAKSEGVNTKLLKKAIADMDKDPEALREEEEELELYREAVRG